MRGDQIISEQAVMGVGDEKGGGLILPGITHRLNLESGKSQQSTYLLSLVGDLTHTPGN
ncbi:hypothetical protein SPLC1_S231010 [Arthrospira platensis C1]|nr:hypothetical protein SPLC1_S231010 [Arthrospira platensis C1]